MDTKSVIIIDDNFVIRESLKGFLELNQNKIDYKIFSSDNGVEGLGYIYTVNPEIIIFDTSLPKYSGRELLEYLTSNPKFSKGDIKVLVLDDGSSKSLPKDFVVLDKRNKNFLNSLRKELDLQSVKKQSITKNLLSKANRVDTLIRRYYESNILIKIYCGFLWLINQIYISIVYTFYKFTTPNVPEEAIEQRKKDLQAYRVRYYPTLITFLVATFILVLELILFITGGIVIFNTRLESVFALGPNEKGIEFNLDSSTTFSYDNTKLEISDSGVMLKGEERTINLDPKTRKPLIEEPIEDNDQITNNNEQTEETSTDNEQVSEDIETTDTEEIRTEEEILGTEETEVLGENSTVETLSQTDIIYPTDNPSITITTGVSYTNLDTILERSNINNDTSSSQPSSTFINDTDTNIAYQLSPDGVNWYYYTEVESRWSKTTQGYTSSNTIQEVNENLDNYQRTLGSGELFLNIFLHTTNANETPILYEVIIEREVGILIETTELPKEPSIEEVIIGSLDWNVVEPQIFNASYVNGNKVIKGKVLLTDKTKKGVYQITKEELDSYKALITYENGDFIGETDLYLNTRGEIEFQLTTPSQDGNFVTATIISKDGALTNSPISEPIENSTFTVDSTADTTDASAGDGLCAASGGECSLRAAIQEANALPGSDNIYFSIPTSDIGYRDYDDPDTASSGDSLGGDDYWTIRPATVLPSITGTTILDATMQIDTNDRGPDIEITTTSGTGLTGLTTTSTSTNSVIQGISINGYQNLMLIQGDGTEIYSNQLGLKANGEESAAAIQNYGIQIQYADNVQIGAPDKGNIISGLYKAYNTSIGVYLNCQTTDPSADRAVIQSNYFGLDYSGTQGIYNGKHIYARNRCDVLIGGDTAQERNYLAKSDHAAIYLSPAADEYYNAEIYNNYFGTGITGEEEIGNYWDMIISGGNDREDLENIIKVGAEGKGNLFKNTYLWSILIYIHRGMELSYNSSNSALGYGTTFRDPSFTGELLTIKNNYFSLNTESDPYFGKSLKKYNSARSDWTRAISVNGNQQIIGNYLKHYRIPIEVLTRTDGNYRWAKLSKPIIGGQAPLQGSLCEGLEKNCVDGVDSIALPSDQDSTLTAAISSTDNPIDIDEVKGNNTFLNVDQDDYLYEQMNYIGFEILSGTARRTDLDGGNWRMKYNNGTKVAEWIDETGSNEFTEISSPVMSFDCTAASYCPSDGDTTGEDGKTAVIYDTWAYSAYETYLYNVLRTTFGGETIGTTLFDIDDAHFASKAFSFDYNSLTNPVVTGEERIINTHTYYDRGEPWTVDPTATNDISNDIIGAEQVMEVEFVDANPVKQDDGSYIITVDSTTDEDNVSTSGYDDGDGAYSGGGYEGPDGLSDGKTSLREAIIVANNFSMAVKIHFNIPATDTGYIDYDDPDTASSGDSVDGDDYWSIRPSTALPSITTTVDIDASSQTANVADSNIYGPEIEISGLNSGSNVDGIILQGANDSQISNLVINGYNSNFNSAIKVLSNNVTIESNYIGSDVIGENGRPNRFGIEAAYYPNGVSGLNIKNNLVAGNSAYDMITGWTADDPSTKFTIQGNKFGTNRDGTASINYANESDGIAGIFIYTTDDITINSNVVSGYQIANGYDQFSVYISNDGCALCTAPISITNNKIGTDITGTQPIPSDFAMQLVEIKNLEMQNNLVQSEGVNDEGGGTINIFGSYWGNGVEPTTNINISNNDIQPFLPGSEEHIIGVNGSVVNINIEDNIIGKSSGAPIYVESNSTDVPNGISMKSNIFDEGSDLKLDLVEIEGENDIRTANDTRDIDEGPNDLQNYPVIRKVTYTSGGQYKVEGILEGNSNEGPWEIEICESDNHESGYGGCIQSLGFVTVENTNANGADHWEMTVTIEGDDGTQTRAFSALATNSNGSTSEFSENYLGYYLAEYPITLSSPINEIDITDRAPLLDWNDNGDLDLDHYDVYFNHDDSGNLVKIGSISDTDSSGRIRTNFRISSQLPLDYTTYYWQVVGVRENSTTGGNSIVESFNVVENIEPMTLIYPIQGVEIDEVMPLLQWTKTDIEDAKYYEIFLGTKGEELELLATIDSINVEEYQLTEEESLDLGEYEWKVVAYYADDLVAAESDTESFKIVDMTSLPITGGDPIYNTNSNDTTVKDENLSSIEKAAILTGAMTISVVMSGFIITKITGITLSSLATKLRALILLFPFINKKKEKEDNKHSV